MCNPIKAIKKVFKKVVKNAKFIVPVVLGAAAIYFTAGAVVGGGSGISGLVGRLGLGSTLSSVLTGAVTQAGIGAALGAGTSALTGGDIGKGALLGGAAGAVTGGIAGAVNAPTTAASSFGRDPRFPQASNLGSRGTNLTSAGLAADAAKTIGANPDIFGGGGETTGLLSGVGKFITDNQELAGGALQGVGKGIGSFLEAGATVEAAKVAADQEAEERAQIAANFDVSGGGGLLTGTTFDTTPRPTPLQQFNPANRFAKTRGAMWRYNPATGQIELTATA